MTKWNKLLILLGVIALTFIILNVNAPQSHGAGSAPVTVVNTPLPVAVTGSTMIGGTVAATQSGPWNVGISGTPNVNVTNTSLPTQNIGGGAATQVGQPASKLVSLICDSTGCDRLLSNGADSGTAFSIPSDEAFVITDVEWAIPVSQRAPGDLDAICLFLSTNQCVARFRATVDPSKFVGGQDHLSTGIAATSASTISVSGLANIQGYLVPNQ